MTKVFRTEEYVETINPKGYINNREITNLDGNYLVDGSRNCLIVNQEKVSSRKGYVLVGSAKSINKGIIGSYDWYNSTGIWRNLRQYTNELEVWYKGSWIRLKNALPVSGMQAKSWWSTTELIDVLLMVFGDDTIREWSGAISEVASVTTNTITKKGYLSGTTYSFANNGASADTITDSANGFVTAGFSAGNEIIVSGSASNDGTYTIASVTAGVLTLIVDDTLTYEIEGASISIKWLNLGTFSEARFFTAGTRKIVIDNVEYEYTGGETTGTLTGVTPSPIDNGVVAGDIMLQAIREYTPATLDGFSIDMIDVFNNYVTYLSGKSRIVYGSKSTDFADFAYSTPRLPTEGFELTLDSTPTAIVIDEDEIKISGGRDDWYKFKFVLSSDQVGETITAERMKTSTGQAARSQDSVIKIKDNIAFLSFEPTIDTIGRIENVEGPQTTPISDDIKNDIEKYDLRNAHGLYSNRSLYLTLPHEGLVLIYDLQNRFWQPPQSLSLNRFALIDIEGDGNVKLCGHSSVGNETYQLFEGYNDNGVKFKTTVAFGYENFGTRFGKKQFDEAAVEIKMSKNTVVSDSILYDYKGASGLKTFTIDGSSDVGRFSPAVSVGGFGKVKLGSAPFGSGPSDDIEDLSKFRRIHEMPLLDFYERQRVFECDSEDMRFEILAYGENVALSENLPTELKSG